MKVWIDILHTPQLNFYKNFILQLSEQGHQVLVTVLGRGKLPVIAKRELASIKNVEVYEIGRHKMTKYSAIFEANLKRYFQLYSWTGKHKFDIALSNGCQACLVAKFRGVPSFSFDDDPQSKDSELKTKVGIKNYQCLYRLPKGEKTAKNEVLLPALKEWAYLNLNVYKPDVSVLEDYGLKPYSYYFFREVSVGTINYAGQAPDSILQIAKQVPADVPVLLSLEKKDNRDLYPKNWILLQEPLRDIHSLIYYSRGLVSSGDSMAREAALLGVPSYYLGIRYSMPANMAAAEVADLNNRQTMSVEQWISKTMENNEKAAERQQELRKQIDGKFIDINAFMLELVSKE